MDQTLFQNLVSAVALAIVSLFCLAVRKGIVLGFAYMEMKLGAAKTASLKQQALAVVRYLEQSPAFQNLANEQKKEMAILQLTKFAEDRGLPLDHNFFDQAIEEAVHIVKKELVIDGSPILPVLTPGQ